jgi:hypothetical protein
VTTAKPGRTSPGQGSSISTGRSRTTTKGTRTVVPLAVTVASAGPTGTSRTSMGVTSRRTVSSGRRQRARSISRKIAAFKPVGIVCSDTAAPRSSQRTSAPS